MVAAGGHVHHRVGCQREVATDGHGQPGADGNPATRHRDRAERGVHVVGVVEEVAEEHYGGGHHEPEGEPVGGHHEQGHAGGIALDEVADGADEAEVLLEGGAVAALLLVWLIWNYW